MYLLGAGDKHVLGTIWSILPMYIIIPYNNNNIVPFTTYMTETHRYKNYKNTVYTNMHILIIIYMHAQVYIDMQKTNSNKYARCNTYV